MSGASFLPVSSAHATIAPPGGGPDPTSIWVYVNNVENLMTTYSSSTDPIGNDCLGEYTDLPYWMDEHTAPDIFIVQQVGDSGTNRNGDASVQLNAYLARLKAVLGVDYAGVLAQRWLTPTTQNCPEKDYQTNAIIYRTDRFSPVRTSPLTWKSRKGTGCPQVDDQRSINVGQDFFDKVSGKYVAVASVHWPNSGNGCEALNWDDAVTHVRDPGLKGNLKIIAGDFNIPDRDYPSMAPKDWWTAAHNDFRDAQYYACNTAGTDAFDCAQNEGWTAWGQYTLINNVEVHHRIDFLFAENGDGTLAGMDRSSIQTVSFNDADSAGADLGNHEDTSPDTGRYSNHRAVVARMLYP